MVQSHDQSSLARRPSNLPLSSRNLSTQELEEVIRRAAELQADSSARLEAGLSGEIESLLDQVEHDKLS